MATWEQAVSDTLRGVGISPAVWQSLARSASGGTPTYSSAGRYGIFGLTVEEAASAGAPRDIDRAAWLQDPANSAKVLAAKAKAAGVKGATATPDGVAELAQRLRVGPLGIAVCALNPNDPACRGALQTIHNETKQVLGGGIAGTIGDIASAPVAIAQGIWGAIPWSTIVGGLVGTGLLFVGITALVFSNKTVQGAAGGLLDGLTDEIPGGTTVKKTYRGAKRGARK